METKNTTLIIGNGFDLNLGMDTSYKSFYLWLKEIGFWEKNSQSPMLQYIKKKGRKR